MPTQFAVKPNPVIPIYSFSSLRTKQREVKERAKHDVVHLTENGNAAYVFCTEEVLERERAKAAAQALEDAEIAELITRGREDVAAGDVIEGIDNIMASLHELWGQQ